MDKDIVMLSQASERLGIHKSQLYRWSTANLDFPSPIRTLGKYKLYDYNEIVEWLYYWQKIRDYLGNKELNNG